MLAKVTRHSNQNKVRRLARADQLKALHKVETDVKDALGLVDLYKYFAWNHYTTEHV